MFFFLFKTEFDTSRLEMGAVADLFDRNGGGLIDWEEFIAALRPDWVIHFAIIYTACSSNLLKVYD